MAVDFVGLAQDFILAAIDFMGEIEDKMESICQKRLAVTVHINKRMQPGSINCYLAIIRVPYAYLKCEEQIKLTNPVKPVGACGSPNRCHEL
jgi:hypothetical protein